MTGAGEKEREGPTHRPPRTASEALLANLRPQPAIPSMLAFVLCIMIPLMATGSGAAAADSGSIFLLLIPVGITVSCGLAVAAGFCSLFPPLAWIGVAAWAFRFTQSGVWPGYNRVVLVAGIIVSAGMICVQIWRVRTGRFQPTVRIDPEV